MFEAEFTHEGDRCTFETLCTRLGLGDPALQAVGEIVHDIDLKEEKFGRPETVGVARLLAGLARRTRDDRERIKRGGELFDDKAGFGSVEAWERHFRLTGLSLAGGSGWVGFELAFLLPLLMWPRSRARRLSRKGQSSGANEAIEAPCR